MDDNPLQFKKDLLAYLCRNIYLHIYSIGDLDDFFWPRTRWLVTRDGEAIDALALLYTGQSLPTLLALTDDLNRMMALLHRFVKQLPDACYAHLSPGVEGVLAQWYELTAHGEHLKMRLSATDRLRETSSEGAFPLKCSDLPEVEAFYKRSYPGNWFDPRMLETGQYHGLREDRQLVSVAGIHVYSPEYRVAALGNIATRSDYRGRGLARRVTAAVCRSLLNQVDHIGLNVKADNVAAIRCYERLGFESHATYGEFSLSRRRV